MTEQRVQRRLAAILAADVVGYSALMERDEEATYAEFERLKRELIEPGLSRHEGRLIKTTGDGALAEFASPLAAMRCAVEIQDYLASSSSSLRLRVGLNLGDVIVGQDGDLYGDGTNIAVRLEGIADPGGILISEKVYSEVEGKLDVGFEDRGEKQLKNISKPVRAYAVCAGAHRALIERLGAAPPLPDKPSIAVLPFENMSGDPDQEYFADGMVEEITTALSRFKSLFVIARNSSFTYKGKAVDIKQVGRELGVRYVLEGSVRKAAEKVRIIGQLIDAATGVHLWADRFEGDLSDIFTLQDRMTESVVSAIEPKMFQTEIDLATRRPSSLSAYDLCLRAIPHLYSFTPGGLAEALRLVSRALEMDPRYGFAATLAGSCHFQTVTQGWTADPKSDFAEGLRLLQLAVSIDGNDHLALSMRGYAAAWSGDFDTAREMVERAVAANPNAAFAWGARGWTYQVAGNSEEAIRSFERAVRLSPFDPLLFLRLTEMGDAFIRLGRFDEAVTAAKKALSQKQTFAASYCCLTTALAHLGREAEAREAATRLLELRPDFHISEWVARSGRRHDQVFIDGLRKAGLPE
ncbi:adenylate/guanylate cyclase domain-containing protein [Bradyrhizobium brasilense]|uniref:adenylate/guanylate cyclase domain-containing protein n=1 Tax=Bradyrhizobium brasilense TaxID=1419277 RepID=UPI001178BFB8|nr:adenylate/guanylate cyclase domain-containing protein [Bradyrhizobium brasilense]